MERSYGFPSKQISKMRDKKIFVLKIHSLKEIHRFALSFNQDVQPANLT